MLNARHPKFDIVPRVCFLDANVMGHTHALFVGLDRSVREYLDVLAG